MGSYQRGKLLQVNANGLYCEQADVYIDPWRPVERAIITHAHADHARWGMKYYLCHHHAKPILKLRLGQDENVQGLAYGEEVTMNGVRISLFPAGHIIGSAQVRLEYKGEIWVFTGDYKLINDGISQPYEQLQCHHFITESTFGLPIYKFPSPFEIYAAMNDYWKQNRADGYNTVLLGYSLGKAQNILGHIDPSIGNIYLHGAVANTNEALASVGYHFPGERVTPETDRSKIVGDLIVAPPSVADGPWLRKMKPYRIAMCSGWMQLRGARRRRGVDMGFALSDHCDWAQLNQAVLATGAEHIYITHGYEQNYARWITEKYGLDAHIFKTLYADSEEDIAEPKEDVLEPKEDIAEPKEDGRDSTNKGLETEKQTAE